MAGSGTTPRLEPGPRRRLGDDGLAVTAIVCMVFVGILAVFLLGIIPLGQATDESARAATAADAAALAAAGGIRDAVLEELENVQLAALIDPLGAGFDFPCAAGSGAAQDLAGRNGADLDELACPPGTGRVQVSVSLRDAGVGDAGPAKAKAAATVRLPLDDCEPPRRPPTTTTTAPPLPPSPPTTTAGSGLPAGTVLTMACGGFDVVFVVGATGAVTLLHPEALAQLLVPRLEPL
jgi:hypothetical protein